MIHRVSTSNGVRQLFIIISWALHTVWTHAVFVLSPFIQRPQSWTHQSTRHFSSNYIKATVWAFWPIVTFSSDLKTLVFFFPTRPSDLLHAESVPTSSSLVLFNDAAASTAVWSVVFHGGQLLSWTDVHLGLPLCLLSWFAAVAAALWSLCIV